MKSIKALAVVALAAGGLALAADAAADRGHGGGRTGAHVGGGHWSGGGHWNRGHWNGGHWRGRGWYGPRVGFYLGAPLFLGSWYAWGEPYGYWGPPVVYREVIREPEVIETIREVPATTEVPRGEGAPTAGPTYMNYCESARAYYPKVTQCPEGWKFLSPTQ